LHRTGWLPLLVAAGIALAAAGPAGADARAGVSSRAFHGAVDVDVRTRSGTVLGELHGHIAASGNGMGTFRPAHRQRGVATVVRLRARAGGSGATVRAVGSRLRLEGRVANDGRLMGAGTLRGRHVVATGVAAEQRPHLRTGMRMLVVGRPRGEGYDALKRRFRVVRYDATRHARHSLRRDRREFRSYAALVFGPDVTPDEIRAHGLLRSFYGAGKWVIAAPSTSQAMRAVGAVHPYAHARPAPAVAVRSVGPQGGHDVVKPTIVYPDPPARAGRGFLTASQKAASSRRRARWFLSHLHRSGAPRMRSGRTPDTATRARTAGSSANFNLPYNAAAIEVFVPYYHDFTVGGSQNLSQYGPCAWNHTTLNAWCTDTWFWAAKSGGHPGDKTAGCEWSLGNGYDIINQQAVPGFQGGWNGDGAYTVDWLNFDKAFVQKPGDACPAAGTQIGNLQGNDYYYAIFDPELKQHTVIALTDPTVSAATNGELWHDNQQNGSGREELLYGTGLAASYVETPKSLQETAWFLGSFNQSFTLSGTNLTDTTFEYSGGKSFPQNSITFTSNSASQSTTQGFSVGIFGDTPTVTYSDSQTESATVSLQVPDWQVSPTPGSRTVNYSWTTNDPISWTTITGGGGGTWDLNPLNKADFNPGSLTVWQGSQTYGSVAIKSTKTLGLVDHYSMWSQSGGHVVDRFATQSLAYGDDPNEITPNTVNSKVGPAIGPGIDLCDPAVMSPDFQTQCGAQPASPTIQFFVTCKLVTGTVGLTAVGQSVGSVPCPPGGYLAKKVSVAPDEAATVLVTPPAGAATTAISCVDQNDSGTNVYKTSTATIPASTLTTGAQVLCYVRVDPA